MPRKAYTQDNFLLELSEKLKRAAYNGPNIRKYSPHEKQVVFHSSKRKRKLYIGGNRSGKTTGGVTEAIWRATCTHPYRPELNALGPTRGRVVGVSFVEGVEKILFEQYRQWLVPSTLRGGDWDSAYDRFTRTLHFVNGSTIEFMSYDQDLAKFAGTSRHWIHFDEEPPKDIYIECMARLIDTNGEFWITMTPVEGITWVYDDLYEKNINRQDDPECNTLIVEINSLENPYLSQEAISSFVEEVNDTDTAVRIGGQFTRKGGRIYKNFSPTIGGKHVLSDVIHEPKDYFKDWLWVLSLDHGLNNPTAVLWHAVDRNGFVVTFDEHYKNEMTVEQHAEAILLKIKQHGRAPDLFIGDPAIAQRNGITNTNIQQEYQKYGLSFMLGNNDVKAGLIRVRKYFNNRKYLGPRTHPLFVDKDDKSIDEFPMLRIAPNCVNLIKELKSYRWKTYTNKKLQYENNPYDEPHKKDDHACDSLRYFIMSQPDLLATPESMGKETFKNKVDSAIAHLVPENDATFVESYQRDIADPWDLRKNGVWEEGDPVPNRSGGGDWSFDEHMGTDY